MSRVRPPALQVGLLVLSLSACAPTAPESTEPAIVAASAPPPNAALTEARAAKRPIVVATKLPSGEQLLLPDPAAPAELAAAATKALDRDESGTHVIGNETWFLHAYNPPLRLIIVGAVHIAQALVPMAAHLGLAVIVVDPRRSFATEERFPNVTVSSEWPDDAMDELKPDVRTAVVTLTHGNKVVEVDPAGKIVWECSNADLPDTFKDPCGAQWLPNGNIVVTSYAAKGDAIKLFEINREKKVVWSRQDGKPGGIHEFQILDTNGKPLEGNVYR
jgi:hypothetical protein